MTWNLFGQYSDVVLACIFIHRMWRLGLSSHYVPFLVFISFECFESAAYILLRHLWNLGLINIDYRIIWSGSRAIAWGTTIWMVYALLTGILRRLPGIQRFSIGFLNVTFGLAIVTALITVRPEYSASTLATDPDWKVRITGLALVFDRAFAFAELLSIVSILTFLIFFPIRVPRNLAVFSSALSIYLCCQVIWRLMATYLQDSTKIFTFDPLPFVMGFCLIYWITALSKSGVETEAT